MPSLISAPAYGRLRFCWAPARLLQALVQLPPRLLALTIAVLVAASACGKKGPPLAPLSNRPRAPEAVSARRVGDQIVVRFTIPRANQSGVQPANIERVDVYALTGPRLQVQQFFEEATVVGSVRVRRPPPEPEENAPPPPPPPDDGSLEQGAQAVVIETLGPGAFEPIPVRERQPERSRSASQRRSRSTTVVIRRTALEAPDIGPAIPPPPTRYYGVVGVNRGGRRGSPSPLLAVTLGPEPPAPAQPGVVVLRDGVEVAWESPAGLRGPVREAEPPAAETAEDEDERIDGEESGEDQEAEAEDESAPNVESAGAAESAEAGVAREAPPGADRAGDEPKRTTKKRTDPSDAARSSGPLRARWLLPWPSATFGYNVYALPSGKQRLSKAAQYSPSALPQLLTPRPLTSTRFVDKTARFGESRCYEVRVVETGRQGGSESESSPPRCVDVADVFPPSAPKSLAAVAGDGSINLIWEANTEPDLVGYLVLRAEAGGRQLEPVTRQVIRETTWRDTTPKRGVRYVYAVVAVDNATPPNRSEPSNQVEETAR